MSNNKKIFGFIAIVCGCFLSILDSTIVNIALPDMAKFFKESLNDISWVSTIYLLSLSVFLIVASKLADQFGRKKVFITGLAIFGASSALCALSSSIGFLIFMRFLQGIGAAILTPVVIPLGMDLFGKEKMGFVVGAAGTITALAAASGPPLGGIIIKFFNWKAIFFVNVPISLLAIILGILFLNESFDKTSSKKIDFAGILLLTSSLFSLVFSLLKGNDYGWGSALIVSLFIISAVSTILFIIVELKVKNPLVPMELFKELTFTASSISYFLTGFAIAAPVLILNFYLERVLNYSTLKAGFTLMSMSLAGSVAMPIGSFLASKFGYRLINFLGILSMASGILLLSTINPNDSNGTIIMNIIPIGLGMGFSAQAIGSSVKHIPVEKNGMASGIVNAARQIGTCLGIAILVSVLNSNTTHASKLIRDNYKQTIMQDKAISATAKQQLLQRLKAADENNSVSPKKIEQSLDAQSKKYIASIPQKKRPQASKMLLKQKKEILNLMAKENKYKLNKVSDAFSNTFKVGMIILYVLSVICLFTDKKKEKRVKLIADTN